MLLERLRGALCAGIAVALLACSPPDVARETAPGAIAEIPAAQLPIEARETLRLIHNGGPFPHRKDGTVFGNRERLLPPRPRGYYLEFTVRTPTERDRGPRRIVAGRGAGGDPATSHEYYYTDDHYASFRKIRE
ncbi:MAG TPA: ribonuclease domain-containing protein [Burkholderiaceae bacterium]|nr:ribonuclease domain-containing protein [Burkholderiaceae bacterium]